ncbi:tetratricopeptide repeat protein [Candidatus Nitrosopelagicus sp.]|nr:tetratricopeptide repeat protein [Candidatus Nitrosopelagicus sp.]
MVEDEELDEATKRILDRTKNIRFTSEDAKRNRSGKRAQKEKISKPSVTKDISKPSVDWDEKDQFWDEIKDLEAEKVIKKIQKELANVNDKKHEIDLWIKLGEKLYYIRKEEEAVEALKAALLRDPGNTTATKALGWCYDKLGRYSDARDCAKKILDKDDKDVDALRDYAFISISLKDWDSAREYYLKVLEIDKKDLDALDNLGYVYYNIKKYDQAIDCFEKGILLERDDDDVYAERNLARCYFIQDKDDECEKYLDLVIKKKPSHKDWYIHYMKGEILVNKKSYAEATEHYKESIRIKETRKSVFALGRCYATQDKFIFAILFYEKSLEISREEAPNTLVNLAACYKKKDNPDMEKALRLCDEALDEQDNYERAIYVKMTTLRELNRLEEAIECIDDFVKMTGNQIKNREILREKVRIYDRLGEGYSIKFLENSNKLAELHNDVSAHLWKAWALEANGKFDEAEKFYDEMIEKWPEEWVIYCEKGDLLHKIPNRLFDELHNYQKARELLEKKEKKDDVERDLSDVHLGISRVIKEMANLVGKQNGLPDKGISKDDLEKEFERDGIDKKGLLDKALSHIDLAIKYNADSWEAWFENGNCFWGLERYNDAFENYVQSLRLNQKNIGIWCCLGDTARLINNSTSEAKYYYQKAISISNKKIKEKNDLEKNLTKRDYDWVDAQNGLIKCLYEEKKYDDVILEADKIFVISKDRNDWGPLRYTALSFGVLKKYSEAIDMWEMGIKEFPDEKWFIGYCYYCASLDANSLGLKTDADEYAKKLIDLDIEESADGYQLQGAYLTENGYYEDAITILEEHLVDFTEHGKIQALRDLISCYDQIGDKEKKEEYEKRLNELKEKD